MGDEQALSANARKGWELFQSKGCVGCHNGPNFTDGNFYRIQVPGSTDLGRFEVTKKEEDRYKFRVQTLRNVALTYPYFNNGSVASLPDAVKVMSKEMLGSETGDKDAALIAEFLGTLTGRMPRVDYPLLP